MILGIENEWASNEQQRCMQDYLLQAGAEASRITFFDTRMMICKNLYHAPDSNNLQLQLVASNTEEKYDTRVPFMEMV